MPYAKLFRSRWAALLWAAGICWTAVDVAGVSPRSTTHEAKAAAPAPAKPVSTGDPETDRNLAILANVMQGN